MTRAVLALALASACAKPVPPVAATPATPATPTPRPPGVPLLVLLVVDQLPVRLLDAVADHYDSGLGRLTGDQAYRGVVRYAHAVTFTCPGHATISTGAAPSAHGIVSNRWLDPGSGEPIYCAQPEFLLSEALADKVVDAGGQVASLSLKDRAAIMMGGHRPTLAAWYDADAKAFNDDRLAGIDIDRWLEEPWTALAPELYAELVGPDEGRYEADPGIGTTFPHPAIPDHPKLLANTPFGGEALVDAAIRAQATLGLGTDDQPDLLAVSFSETDYIGHAHTSESWEALDNMLRLDDAIGRLLAHLDATVGADRYTVMLTSDHGSVQPTEVRVDANEIRKTATSALSRVGGDAEVLFEDPGIYLPAAVRSNPDMYAQAMALIAEEVSAIAGIHSAYPWRTEAPTDELAEDVMLSVHPDRSGDLYVVLAPGALYDYHRAPGKGTSHGTPWDDDQRVPFLAAGAGITPGTGAADADVRQVAVTAAALLGVGTPADATLAPIAGVLASE